MLQKPTKKIHFPVKYHFVSLTGDQLIKESSRKSVGISISYK